MWGKGNPRAMLVGMHTCAATVKNSMEFLKQLKLDLPFDPAIPLLGIYPKNPKSPIRKNLHSPMFIPALFTIGKY